MAKAAGPVNFWRRALSERETLLAALAESGLGRRLDRLADTVAESMAAGGKVLLFGNGGSAADAQHAAAEWVGRFLTERPPLPAVALSTDPSVLTAVGNDYGFERVFERQVQALALPGDVAIGISTSGESENVIRALRMAKRCGARTAALLGGTGGRAGRLAGEALVVPSSRTPLVQEAHGFLLHVLCEEVERRLKGRLKKGRRGGPSDSGKKGRRG
ncbi:MAG: SIS domain-containing protein [Candidatus Tectomicrobia bacterium]|nr:SIS domain-containing protein [Candidatus Tectomicrobia bacterium]